jgi:serine/threonine protein kinase/Flp pilus assembly protein TadD
MAAERNEMSEREQRLGEIAFAYLEARDKGQAPDERDLLTRHPEFAEELAEFLADQANVERFAASLRPAILAGQAPTAANGAAGVPHALGDFRLLREVGHGGMGIVYEAEQLSLGRRVALKVLPFAATMDPRQLQRFQNEARAAASLEHPHIVPVYGVGCERGVHYYAMKFIDGQTLAAMIDAQHTDHAGPPSDEPTTDYRPTVAANPTTPIAKASTERIPHEATFFRSVAEWGIQAAEALEHAHSMGIVHRDIKPANLMIDGQGKLWVTDFGLARTAADSGLTMTGDLVGTLRYMSPEQALAKHGLVDHRTDVYSLGVTLYELLTGTPAADGMDREEILNRITREEPRQPRTVDTAIPRDLETIVLKAVAKTPSERYASAGELADDLRRFLEDKPIRAKRPTLVQRAAKWSRGHRPLVWSAVVALVAILTAVVSSAGYVVRDRGARLATTEQKVAAALAAARTAIEAGDLALASQLVAEAQGYLGAERDGLPDTAADIDRVRQDIDTRQSDAELFRQFRKLADDAQNKMSYRSSKVGEGVAQAALALYGVLEAEDWLSRLERSTLSMDQKRQVRETAYVTLVSLADFKIPRFPRGDVPRSIEPSLDLLRRAEAFHPPTPAFYFVRSECHRRQGNAAAADEDRKRFKAAAPQTVWDYYQLGQSAAWAGDLDEAIRLYRKALAVQPDHYNALYFFAGRLAKKREYPEAIGLFTGCIALRPDDIWTYIFRGECHQELRHLDDAEADFSAAITAAKDETDRIKAYGHRLGFYHSEGRTEQARQDAERLLALAEPRLEAFKAQPDADLLMMNDIAIAYCCVGRRVEEAVALFELTVERQKADSAPDDTVMRNLASAYHAVGRVQEAVAMLEPMLERLKAKLGPDHTDTLSTAGCLAASYSALGRHAEAIKLREKPLALEKAKLGPNHPVTLLSMNNLALDYLLAGRPRDAIALYEPTLEKAEVTLGPDHPATLIVIHNLAHAYQTVGRLPEAIALFEQLLVKQKARPKPDPNTEDCRECLAFAYEDGGQFDRAEPLWVELLEFHRKTDSPKSPTTAGVLASLGRNLLKQRKYAEAEPVLRECLRVREEKLPDDWSRFNAMSMLGGALFGQKKYADAEPLLLQGYEGMKQREAKIPLSAKQHLPEAVERIVRLYEATGQPKKAQAWRAKLPPGAPGGPRPLTDKHQPR